MISLIIKKFLLLIFVTFLLGEEFIKNGSEYVWDEF